jgi:GNAT superfamily N-acetyltransferase
MITDVKKLDNPTWYSLCETHQEFAVKYEGARFYQPDYCPFGGFINANTTIDCIDNYSTLTNNFYVVGEKPCFGDKVKLFQDLVCDQMFLEAPIKIEVSEFIVELKTTPQTKDLFTLVNSVQPGYFKNKTSELGSYYGIYKEKQLIAVTGERMKMNMYTEVSAVVTHPKHTGKGYAKQLVAHTTNKIFSENKLPYLHVSENNINAIRLYEKLGFKTRRKISFWNLTTEFKEEK